LHEFGSLPRPRWRGTLSRTMNIRPATEADVPEVLPMVDKLAALHERWDAAKYPYLPNVGEMYRAWLRSRVRDPRGVFLVADRERLVQDLPFLAGFLVGTVEREIPIYRTKEFGFIHDVWVEEDYRNEGIGRQMTMLAIEKFREIGVRQIRLDTATPNEIARTMFTSLGFRPSMTEMLLEI
jgi:ribosomal protein S18 acetylase RimI-like enzyme